MWGRALAARLSRRRVRPVLNSRKASVSIMVSPHSACANRELQEHWISRNGGNFRGARRASAPNRIEELQKGSSAKPIDQWNGQHYGCEKGSHPSHFATYLTFDGESRSEEHTSELQSRLHLVCRLLLEKKQNRYASYPAARLVGAAPEPYRTVRARDFRSAPHARSPRADIPV